MLGIVSNLVGIVVMLYFMQKHGLCPRLRLFERLFSLNLKRAGTAVATVSVMAVALAFLLAAVQVDAADSPPTALDLAPIVKEEKYVSFEVTPIDFSFGQSLAFEIRMNTHQVDLDFDLTEISVVRIDRETTLEPIAWEGSSPGGHHRNGRLFFPVIPSAAEQIDLIIADVADVPERIFSWKVK